MWCGKESLPNFLQVVWQMHFEWGHMMGRWRDCPTAGCRLGVSLQTVSLSGSSLSFWGSLKYRFACSAITFSTQILAAALLMHDASEAHSGPRERSRRGPEGWDIMDLYHRQIRNKVFVFYLPLGERGNWEHKASGEHRLPAVLSPVVENLWSVVFSALVYLRKCPFAPNLCTSKFYFTFRVPCVTEY